MQYRSWALSQTDIPWWHSLDALDASDDLVSWSRQYGSFEQAWASCPHAHHLLWVAARLAPPGSPAERAALAAACVCARGAVATLGTEDAELLLWVDSAERWALGEAVTLNALESATGPRTELLEARRAAALPGRDLEWAIEQYARRSARELALGTLTASMGRPSPTGRRTRPTDPFAEHVAAAGRWAGRARRGRTDGARGLASLVRSLVLAPLLPEVSL